MGSLRATWTETYEPAPEWNLNKPITCSIVGVTAMSPAKLCMLYNVLIQSKCTEDAEQVGRLSPEVLLPDLRSDILDVLLKLLVDLHARNYI